MQTTQTPSGPRRSRAAIWQQIVPLALYLAGALYLMARVLPQFTSSIPGSGIALADGWQNTWNMWWTRLALARGQNPFFTTMVFYPEGKTLYLHTMNITNALLTLPVQLIASPAAAYNVATILGFVLTGYASYLLALRFIERRGVACAVGALVTFSPFHVSKLIDGHLSWITMQWIPCVMLCMLRALESGRWRWRLLAGLSLAVATLTSWYYALFSAIFIALLLAVRLPGVLRARSWRSELATLLIVAGLAGLGSAPVLVPALREYVAGSTESVYAGGEDEGGFAWDRQTDSFSADLVDLFFPSPLHPLWGEWATQAHHEMHAGWFWTITPGFGVLLLAIYGGWVARKRVRPLIVLLGLLLLLMLGPELRVAGVSTGVPLPFDLLKVLPGMTLGHRPNHLAIFALPLLMVLAGLGIQALLAGGRAGKGTLALLGLLAVAEMIVLPLPTLPLGVDPGVAQLRGQAGAVLDLPNDKRSSASMRNQMVHERPIIEGYLARPQPPSPIVSDVPWVRALWQLQGRGKPDIIAERADAGQQALSFYAISTIIVRRDDLADGEQKKLRQALDYVLPGATPSYQGALVDIYTVAPVANPAPFAFLGAGWGDRESEGGRVWRWIGDAATLHLANPDSAPRQERLSLTLQSFEQARPLTLQLDGQQIGALEIQPATNTQQLSFTLPPGAHTLQLASSPGTEPAAPHRSLSLSFSSIALEDAP